MTATTGHMSISLDGFVARPSLSRENPLGVGGMQLHGWHLGEVADCYCIPVSIVRLAVLMRPLRTRTTRGVTPEPRRKAVVVTEYRPGGSRTRYVPFALVVTLARTPPSCEKRSNTRLAGFEHEAASTHSGPFGDSVTLPWTPDGVCPARAAPEAPTNSASSVGKSHFRAA